MRILGSLPDNIPENHLDFPLAGVDRETIYRQHSIGPVHDQRDRPWCVGYSLLSLCQADPIRQSPLTAEEIYNGARKLAGTPKTAEGAQLTSAVRFLQEKGVIKKAFWTAKAENAGLFIFETGPIVISIPWSTKMDKPAKDGRCKPGGDIYGYHAVLGYAYDSNKKHVTFLNSWGKEFGNSGSFYLTMRDFTSIMNKGGIGCAVTE